MSLWDEPRWGCAAIVTPIQESGQIDVARLAAFGARLLDHGLNGLVLFGTTGEGASFSVAERLEATAALIKRGLDPDRLVLGITSSAVSEMAWLVRGAAELGIAGVLGAPPFYFRDVEQEGVYQAYAAVIEAAGAPIPPLLLYHIPQVTGIPVAVDTLLRLAERYPKVVRGIKDSGADLAYTRDLLSRFAARGVVLVGTEAHIPEVMTLGGKGTICGMANLIPAAIKRLVEGDADALESVSAVERALSGVPVIPVVKAAIAEVLGDPAWQACVPPLLPASRGQITSLVHLAAL